jgi:BolA family transcriptional regulator, general stress-responsive regulator
MNSERTEKLRDRLQKALQPNTLEIIDESARHAGHAGAASGGGHFIVNITSAVFRGKTPLQRHRLVFDAVGAMMQQEIHALSINARTPEEES